MQFNGYFFQQYGIHLFIEEIALSQGQLYSIVTNKKA